MNIAIIISTDDAAAMNMKTQLLKQFPFKKTEKIFDTFPIHQHDNVKLYTTNKRSVFYEHIDQHIQADLFIFATKHESKSGINSLSCHTQGNWGSKNNIYGGSNNNLGIAPASYLKRTFQLIKQTCGEFAKQNNYDIVMECTHHGPDMKTPSLFIEIGSDEASWQREDTGMLMARVIMKVVKTKPKQYPVAVGIGGMHTCNAFLKIQRGNEYALGHICPKYMLDQLTKEMVEQAIEKTTPKAEAIILDWKGLGKHKEKIKQIVGEINLPVLRTKNL